MEQASEKRPTRARVLAWREPIVSTTLLAIASYILVVEYAFEEPFCCLRAQDAFRYAGLGSILFVLLGLNLLYVAKTFIRNRRRFGLGIPAVVTLLGLWFVAYLPMGYLSDLDRAECSDTGQCLGLRKPRR